MNIPLLAAEIARLIPELARDSQVNNAEFLERLIQQHISAHVCAHDWKHMPLATDSHDSPIYFQCSKCGQFYIQTPQGHEAILKAIRDNPPRFISDNSFLPLRIQQCGIPESFPL